MSADETLDALRAELDRARAKFPKNDHLFAALGEEVGELARELLENGARERIRAEAIQVACVALRIADEGDGDFPKSMPEKEPAERCAFPECKRLRTSDSHGPCVATPHFQCYRCGDGGRNSWICHDFVPPQPEPAKPVARYASGEEPMVGDVVRFSSSPGELTVTRLSRETGSAKGWIAHVENASGVGTLSLDYLFLARRAEATK